MKSMSGIISRRLKGASFALIMLAGISVQSSAQNTRIKEYNRIGWWAGFGTLKLNKQLGIHVEYQWRRENFITDGQQGLLRVGLNYLFNPNILGRAGYAWVETLPYGDFPINGMGKDFTEHRIFEMIQLTNKEGRFDVSHRFMLEQRFVGRYSSASLEKEDTFPLQNRIRYMIRVQAPLKGYQILDKTPYMAFYNEVFIGFGKNVQANIFDQNRIGLLFGYGFNKHLRLEAGYLNQIVQLGRLVNGNNVFQHNHGLIVIANVQF